MASLWERFGRRIFKFQEPAAVYNEQPRRISIQYQPKGSSGTEIYSGYFSEEYLQELRGTRAADVYDKMRRSDPKIKMALSAIKNPIIGANWSVQPADESERAKLHAEFIEQVLFSDLHQGWEQQLAEFLTCLDFGNAVFEVTHQVMLGHPKFGNYNSIAKLGWRSPRTIETWNLDDMGRLKSITQYAYGDLGRRVEIPGRYLIVFSLNKEGDNYEGVSALRTCYGPWLRKETFLKLMAVGIEKSAFKIPVLTVPAGQETSAELDTAKAVLEAYLCHEKQYITKPTGWDLDFADVEFDPSKMREAIDRENMEIAHAFLENFLELGQGGSGSYALSYDLSDFFLSSIEHVAKYVADVLNRGLVSDLIKLNFGPQASYPKLQVSGIKDKPGKEYAEVMKLLVDSKILVPDGKLEENLRKRYGMPVKSLEDQRSADSSQDVPAEPLAKPVVPGMSSAKKLHDLGGSFKVQAVEISKKVAQSRTDAERFALDLGFLIDRALETEFSYRFEQCSVDEIVVGSTKSFSPLEGVQVFYGLARATPSQAPSASSIA